MKAGEQRKDRLVVFLPGNGPDVANAIADYVEAAIARAHAGCAHVASHESRPEVYEKLEAQELKMLVELANALRRQR